MAERAADLAEQVEAVVQRLMADPFAGPTRAELDAAAVAAAPTTGLAMGAMVELTGLSEHTLRYYEREQLVHVERRPGGQRRYDAAAVQRVLLITRMRISGMPMATLKQLTTLLDEHGVQDPRVAELLQAHRDQLRRHIAELQLALAITEYKIETGRLEPGPMR